MKVDLILTSRLLELYDPWDALQVDPRGPFDCPYPEAYVDPLLRSEQYHLGRIAFFRDKGFTDPLEIDNFCDLNRVLPLPMLLDGHHRLCGACLSFQEWVPALYSGRLDLLNYLTGKRKTAPTA